MDSATVERRVAVFIDACRRLGIKATHQRTEILRELVATQEHPDAETIYARVRQCIPTISLDSVCRAPRMLDDNGVIARVGSVWDRARFDANTDRHQHFVCCERGTISDFYSDVMGRFPVPRKVTEMGSMDRVYVELRGRCRKCQAGAKNHTR